MEDYNEEQFRTHIAEVVAANEMDNSMEERPLTLAELKELAISMGLTDEEWEKLLLKANTHLKSADDHLAARNFVEAIEEGKKATGINPYISNGNAVLAKSYLMLWLENHETENRDAAEYHARKELKVDPRDQIAINVLSTIEKKSSLLEKDNKSRNTLFIVVGVVIFLIVIGLFWNSSASQKDQIIQDENIETAEFERIQDKLIEAEEDVNSKWDMVITAINRRNELIPKLFNVLESSDEEVAELNSAIEELQGRIDDAVAEERYSLENDLESKINELKTIVQMGSGDSNVETLLIQVEGSENRISFEKKAYNESIKNYNILVKKNKDKFPEYEVKPYFNAQ